MVNEALDLGRISRMDMRDRFQVGLATAQAEDHTLLWDIGSGSGRFLFHVKKHFGAHLGIEITEDCIRFGREQLGLNIQTSLEGASGQPTLVTMWHSLEHMPTPVIESLLPRIRKSLAKSGRLLISVPNGGSRHFSFFGAKSVYYDLPNHIHQFSAESLERLLERHGFRPLSYHGSFMYAFFGSLLSFINLLSPRHNYLYEEVRRKAGWSVKKLFVVGLYGAVSLLLLPLAGVAYVLAKLRPRAGSVLTGIFVPRD